MTDDRPPLLLLTALGMLSLVAFGVWFYGYGVLLEPIRRDTGWAEGVLSTAYGASLLATGIGALVAGRLIDRGGARALFAGAGLVSAACLLGASLATDPWIFAFVAVVGGGTIGAGGYYPATQAVMGSASPGYRTKGITGITLFGAFASPVFLPLIGWLVTAFGWRPTLRLLALVTAVAFLGAAAVTPAGTTQNASEPYAATLRRIWGRIPLRRFVLAGFAAGIATSLLFLYQVPVMVDAGLTLTLASSLAGARGLMQLAGRLPLPPVVRRIGSDRALRASFALTGLSIPLLLGSGTVAIAVAFVVVAGVATGAMAALEGIYASDLTPTELGTLLGAFSLLRGLGAALGPALGGLAVEVSATRTPALLFGTAAALAAAALLPRLAPHPAAGGAEA